MTPDVKAAVGRVEEYACDDNDPLHTDIRLILNALATTETALDVACEMAAVCPPDIACVECARAVLLEKCCDPAPIKQRALDIAEGRAS